MPKIEDQLINAGDKQEPEDDSGETEAKKVKLVRALFFFLIYFLHY